jgi:hypothetical protein
LGTIMHPAPPTKPAKTMRGVVQTVDFACWGKFAKIFGKSSKMYQQSSSTCSCN